MTQRSARLTRKRVSSKEQLAAQMAVIQEAGQRFLATLDRTELLEQAAHIIADYFGHQHVALALADGDSYAWVVPAAASAPPFSPDLLQDAGLSYGCAARTGQAVLIDDVAAQQRWRVAPLFLAPRSELTVAIPGSGRIIGVLTIQSGNPHDFDEHDLALLETLAGQLGLALENARLYSHALRRASELGLVHEVQRVLDSPLELEPMLRQAAAIITRTLGYRYVQLCLLFGDQLLQVDAGSMPPESAPLSGVAEVEALRALSSGEVGAEARLLQNQASLLLRQGDRVLGLLNVVPGAARELVPTELHVLEEIADRIALTVDRALLFAEVQSTAEREAHFGRIVAALRRSLDPEEIALVVCRELVATLHVDYCSVSLLQHESAMLTSLAAYSEGESLSLPKTSQLGREDLLFLKSFMAEGLALGVISDSTTQDSPLAHYMRRHGMRAGLLATLPLDQSSSGLLSLCLYEQPRGWSPQMQRLGADVAAQLSQALRQARLYAAEQQRRRELETLQEVISTIGEANSLEVMLMIVARKIAEVFAASSVSVLMRHKEGDDMRFFPGYGLPPAVVRDERVRREQVSELLQRFPAPHWFYLGSVHDEGPPIFERLLGEDIRSLLGLPLIMNGFLMGWLLIGSSEDARSFSSSEQQLGAALAKQVAMAAHNLRRYEEEVLLRADVEASYNHAKAVLEELEQTKDQLIRSEKQRALGELASGVAHDFNNLLAAILGNVQMLRSEETDPERQEMLQVIEQVSRDGATIVRRIQDFARSQETAYDEVVDLKALALGALDIARPAWRSKAQRYGLAFDVVTELEPGLVLGSAAELREVVVNLLLNAAYAMSEGGVLTIRTGRQGDNVFLSVSDTGSGIKPEDRARIFDPFFTTKPVGSGSGLGLSIALSIIQRHRGNLDVDTAIGVGSTFTVVLPVYDQEMAVIVTPQAPRPVPPGERVSRRILVVDDDQKVRQAMEHLIQREGHHVVTAVDGIEALEALDREPIDLVFSDLGMPGINGWDLLAEVRRRFPHIKTVLISGWGYEVEPREIQEQGVDLVLAKPSDQQTIADTIITLCGPRVPLGEESPLPEA